jgi:hypothetical protein
MSVKLQSGRVITKEGRVSCECCDECCMYPAEALANGLYAANDLPDEITIHYCSVPGSSIISETATRSGNSFVGANSSVYLQNNIWFVEAYDNFIETDFNCLIGSLPNKVEDIVCTETIKGFGVEDRFADAYAVSGPISGTVTRESICVWRSPNLQLTNFGFQWKVNGNNKSGFQNTPEGSYAGGFTVS